MKYFDGLLILLLSFLTASFCELISWVLIYRTPRYKSLKATIEKTSKRVETIKEKSAVAASTTKKSSNKKVGRFEQDLKEANQAMSYSKFQSGAVVAVTLFLVFGLLSSLFDGKPVAKLPFAPAPFFQRMTHRGLAGDDPTDCSFVFLYMLCSVSIRPNLQKLLGFAPPRASATPAPF